MWLEPVKEEYNNNRRKGKGMTKSGRRRKAYSGACWKERVKNQVCRDDRWTTAEDSKEVSRPPRGSSEDRPPAEEASNSNRAKEIAAVLR